MQLTCVSSTFRDFLSTAVKLEKVYHVEYRSFLKSNDAVSAVIDLELEASFLHCNFDHLSSVEGNGGAIASEWMLDSFLVDKCDFHGCSADGNGGTLYILSSNSTILLSCFSGSHASDNCSVSYFRGANYKSITTFDSTTMSQNGKRSTKSPVTVEIENGFQFYKYTNFSDNYASEFSTIYFNKQHTMQLHFSNFARNVDGTLLYYPYSHGSKKNPQIIHKVNIFYNNCTRLPLISGKLNAVFNYTYFSTNRFSVFYHDLGQSLCIFDNCHFDISKRKTAPDSVDEYHGDILSYKSSCVFDRGPAMTHVGLPFTNNEVCYITQRVMPFTNPAVLDTVVFELARKLENPHLVAGIVGFTVVFGMILKTLLDRRTRGRRPHTGKH